MVVAKPPYAAFDVGFLNENGIPISATTVALIDQALSNVGFGILFAVKQVVGALKPREERLRTINEPGFQERRLCLDVFASLGKRVVDGTG